MEITRKTNETKIRLSVSLDGGKSSISTGIGFFDHMLTAFSVHGGFGINLHSDGDLNVDGHHTVEDVGIVLGQVFNELLGDKSGIVRFGHAVIPMDESLCECTVDISNRPYLVFNAEFTGGCAGEFDLCLTKEFFYALCMKSGITMHINVPYGENDHHKCEAIFKAAAHALRKAVQKSDCESVLSSKGML
ncbi:MAG: imidazoleglycerol-phosphate dehydratase HisB [Oscillospiraceae bacterium]|jgi:imidazoleglycerol-phosphate dehydratase|nr:imidazoleglycerol-phosphate dehydratase HisB [Oscillospiraceae bacterium]